MKLEKVYGWVVISVVVLVVVCVFGFFSLVSRTWDNTMTDKYLPVVIGALKDIVLATVGSVFLAHIVPVLAKIAIANVGTKARQLPTATLPPPTSITISPPKERIDKEQEMIYRDIT